MERNAILKNVPLWAFGRQGGKLLDIFVSILRI